MCTEFDYETDWVQQVIEIWSKELFWFEGQELNLVHGEEGSTYAIRLYFVCHEKFHVHFTSNLRMRLLPLQECRGKWRPLSEEC